MKKYSFEDNGLFLLYIPWHFPLDHNEVQGCSKEAERKFEILYPSVYQYLSKHKSELSARNQVETNIRYEWYALQRFGSKYMDDFSKQKIVWSRLMRISKDNPTDFPRFSLVPEGYYILDSLCMITGIGIDKYVNVLNSEYAAYYFFKNIAILDNGGMQMRQQYVENIPIPINIHTLNFENKDLNEINKMIFKSFKLKKEDIGYIQSFLKRKYNEIKGLGQKV